MTFIETFPLKSSTILRLNSERDSIDIHPEYQRSGDIWNLEKRQLLIDSILNDYDIPKLYFHALNRPRKVGNKDIFYAIIDGRQRIETVWKFIDGEFPLDNDFIFFKDKTIKAGGLTYSEIASKYPKLKVIFDSFILPITCVRTENDDIFLIEDMFSRLNEAVTLNAADYE